MRGPVRIVVLSVIAMALFAALLWITFSVVDRSEPSAPVTALPDDPAASAAPPSGRADLVGRVTRVAAYDLTDDEQTSVGGMDVKGDPAGGGAYDAAAVTITKDTAFFRRVDGELQPTRVDLPQLEGATVEVWFTGPVAESYPVQATAGAVAILD